MRDRAAAAACRSFRSRRKCRGFSASRISGSCAMRRRRSRRRRSTQGKRSVASAAAAAARFDSPARTTPRRASAGARRSPSAASGLPEGVPALVRLLQTDADPEVRQMAAFALGLIGDQSAVEPLRAAVADPLAARRRPRSRSARPHRRHRVGARDRQTGGDSRGAAAALSRRTRPAPRSTTRLTRSGSASTRSRA